MPSQEDRISNADYSRLRELIYSQAGIALGPSRKVMLEGRIRRRLKALAFDSYRDYCGYLFSARGLREELVQLIDVVTTNKTDFFREPRHFEYLTSTMLAERALSGEPRKPLLVWSAGCSSGEEPWTLAMVLSDYELSHPGFSFRIVATDISTAVLEKAEQAIYPAELVRPVPQSLRLRYFMRGREPGCARVRVVPELRRLVEFRRLNFMDPDYGQPDKVDAIFCRNVIIYFDRPTQQTILEKLVACLAPRGYLFMGHAETLRELDLPLIQVAPALYRRVDAGI